MEGRTAGLDFDLLGAGVRPVLLLHGLGGERGQPLALAGDALRARCLLVAPDLREHGRTMLEEGPESLTIGRLAEDVEALLDELGLERDLTVVGISMGAAVAAELMARGRVEVRAFVMVRPAWRWAPGPPNLAVFALIARLLSAEGPVAGKEVFRRGAAYAEIAKISRGAAEALLAQFDAPQAAERAQRLARIPLSAPARPAHRRRRGLVIGADRDPVHPLALAAAVAGDLGVPLRLVAPRYDAPERHTRQVSRTLDSFVRDG